MSSIVHGLYATENHKRKHIHHQHDRQIHTATIGQPCRYCNNGNGNGFQRKEVQTVIWHIFLFDFYIDFFAVAISLANTLDGNAILLKCLYYLHTTQILNRAFHHIILCLLMNRCVFVAVFFQKI